MTRLKAFATHLGISLIIFLVVLYFILFQWYPFPFFTTDGGWKGIQILAFVDVVLGPLLTLIVFKPGKKHLKIDMTVIGLVQAAALAWGIWVIHHERPAAAVFVEDYFSTVTTYDIGNRLTPEERHKLGNRMPYIVNLNVPREKLQEVRLLALQTRRPMSLFTEYYAPLDTQGITAIVNQAADLAQHVADKPQFKTIYDRFMASHKSDQDKLLFLEWHGRNAHGYVAAYRDTLEFIEFLRIDPIPVEKKKVRY